MVFLLSVTWSLPKKEHHPEGEFKITEEKHMKIGLVMEGGAMRGMFTAGVTDVLMENNISFDAAIGVSAGATFGCNVKSRQPGRAIRYNKKYCADWRYGSIRSFLHSGSVFDYDFCYHLLPEKLDPFDTDTFSTNPMPFYVVASDLESGRPIYKLLETGKGKDLAWICASASMPLVSKTVLLEGHKYLDGGITDSIPLAFFESIGYARNLVIETQPEDYIKQPNGLMPLIRTRYRAYPRFVAAMENRHLMYNQETAYVKEQEAAGKAFVIRPPKALNISSMTTDPSELQRVYMTGRKAAEKALPALVRFLDMEISS